MLVKNNENLVVLRQKVLTEKINLIVIEITSIEILFVVSDIGSIHQNVKRAMFPQKGLEFMEIAETFRSTFFRAYSSETQVNRTFFYQMLHFSCNVLFVH